MGTGVHILRTLSARYLLPVCLVASGCIDFVEPDIAEQGGPATIQATIRLTDLGTVEVDARLVPGLDGNGLRRSVEPPPLEVLGRMIDADTIGRNGTRRYVEAWVESADIVGDTMRFRAPAVSPVIASAPAVAWLGLRREGPDTVRLESADDLRLVLRLTPGSPQPVPQIRQWFLRLATDTAAFNISADGAPPDTLIVPARWIPAGDSVGVRLIFNQSSVLREPPGDYVGLITLDTRLFWTVRRRASAAAPAG